MSIIDPEALAIKLKPLLALSMDREEIEFVIAAVRRQRGRRHAITAAKIAARDAALRNYAQAECPGFSIRQATAVIIRDLDQYFSAAYGWRMHADHSECPLEIRGTSREALWTALRNGAGKLKERQIRNILSLVGQNKSVFVAQRQAQRDIDTEVTDASQLAKSSG